MTEKSSPFLQMNAAPPSPGRKTARALGAIIGLILLALAAAAVWWRFVMQPDLIFGAVVDGQREVVTAWIGGRVTEVRAAPEQVVGVGQPLVFLSPGDGADTAASAGEALEAMRERVASGERAEKEARAATERASLEHARRQLALRGAGQPVPGSEASRQERERLRAEAGKAGEELEAAKNRSEAASLARQSVEDVYRQMRETIRRARAGGTQADPAQTVLTAPMAGRISLLDAAPGMRIRPGQTLAVIDPILPEQIWITGFVHPANLTKLQPGMRFTLRFPDHPESDLAGHIDAIQENPPQKDLPGLPVRLRLTGYDPLHAPPLVIGQKVDVLEE